MAQAAQHHAEDPARYMAQCAGKEPFDSPRVAWRAAARKPHRIAYRCPHCGRYHVGNEGAGL